MSISSIGTSSSYLNAAANASASTPRTLFELLSSNVKSGDFTSAQTVLAKLKALLVPASTDTTNGTATGSSTTGDVDSLRADMANLAQAIQSGDPAAAKAALAKLRVTAQAASEAHRRKYRPDPPAAASPASSTSTAPTTGTALDVRA